MKQLLLLAGLGATGLGGCAVYVPTAAVMPLVRAPRETDARVGVHPSGRLEATAAHSPLPHLVLSGTGMVGLLTGGRQYLRTRQGELGLGGYWLLGQNQRWLLNATTGGGLASMSRMDCPGGGCGGLRGRYRKGFGQLGIAYTASTVDLNVSFNYRLSRVAFSSVVYDEQPLANFGSYRHDLTLAFRYSLGSLAGKWYLQSIVGTSISSLSTPGDEPYGQTQVSDRWYAAGRPLLIASIGVCYYYRPARP